MDSIVVKLTKPEINHLLTLLGDNENVGWYFGPLRQWQTRHKRIKDRLKTAVKTNQS